MKVIDLLNKIANGEGLPKRIKEYDGSFEYEYVLNDNNWYESGTSIMRIFRSDRLNDEVEIIEDKKIPEKIDEDFFEAISGSYRDRIMKDKIDEIIDYLEDKQC